MGNCKACSTCEHLNEQRRKDDKYRCTRHSMWVKVTECCKDHEWMLRGENMGKPRMIGMIKKPMNLKNTGKGKPFEAKKGNATWEKQLKSKSK